MTWLAVLLAVTGLGVLTLGDVGAGLGLGYGEALTLVAALIYALHIVGLGAWSNARDALGMSILQCIVIAVLCAWRRGAGRHRAPATGRPTGSRSSTWRCSPGPRPCSARPGRRRTSRRPARAIIMSMEPVFAALFAVLLGGESATPADAARRRAGAGRDADRRAGPAAQGSRPRSPTSQSDGIPDRWMIVRPSGPRAYSPPHGRCDGTRGHRGADRARDRARRGDRRPGVRQPWRRAHDHRPGRRHRVLPRPQPAQHARRPGRATGSPTPTSWSAGSTTPSGRRSTSGRPGTRSPIGPDTFTFIAGPCAVETAQQTLEAAEMAKAAGATLLRGGAYKPRTSPYAFQGLGVKGLEILADVREVTGLPVVTEIVDARDVEGGRRARRHAPDRHPQHGQLRPAAGRRRVRQAGAAQARA